MQRLTVATAMLVFTALSALGQQPRIKGPDKGIVLEGEPKLRYIVKQLKLTDKQKGDVDSLLAVYNESMKAESDTAVLLAKLNDIQTKLVELQEARAAGDTKRVEQLKEEVRKITPGAEPEREFFENLNPTLTQEQREKLEHVRKRIDSNPDVSLQPLDVIQTAQAQNLDPGQREKIDGFLTEFRNEMASNRPGTQAEKFARVDQLVARVRTVLNPNQAKAFDEEIERLRPPMPKEAAAPAVAPASRPRAVIRSGSGSPVTVTPEMRSERSTLEGAEPADLPQPNDPPAPPQSQPSNP